MSDASKKEDDEGKAQIRHARREDVPIILQLIQELAAYEKESDAVEATPALLLQTIAFAPPPLLPTVASTSSSPPDATISAARPARCLLLFAPDGTPAGMALYFYNYSTWKARPGIYLEDLFVREEHRGRGYGQRLLAELAREVVGMDGGRLEWCVLKWNAPSIGFYESGRVGARAMSEWQTMRVDGEALMRLAERAG
ncbi:gcn5-related n-acetyltransferase [Drepanopeziza brunnea f. sp. 'multigermtubi' MB_m1]|uniref:Gcn5-related n-acetyltransferase n=1 Tax=Marssonina brunnea f. sp. multigermtubi (strain MB_m1) TaxID=1072389 RepID=K1X9K0_MARBU|nr:gcn5-related n-acetyltransferase [Drepanopeziza brunnea f. sp. 'multigermtubi' MB_m1]EKD21647.1 gcn5-related n-acetyltransferase [Drepanopeziza brunnea f. sp. 'multigermtubi' MB_m1]